MSQRIYDNFKVNTRIADFVAAHLEDGNAKLAEVDTKYVIGGRVRAIDSFGKAAFIRIQDSSGSVQVYIRKNVIGEEAFAQFKLLRIDDVVGVSGGPMRTKAGKLTLVADSFRNI